MNNSLENRIIIENDEFKSLLKEEVHWIFKGIQFIKKLNCCCI